MAADSLLVLILAAGKSTRMKSETPKVLHKVAGVHVLRWVLEQAATLKPVKTVVIVGHGADRVQKAAAGFPGIEFVTQEPQQGTGHAVMQARKQLESVAGEVCVLCGDVPLIRPETLAALRDAHFFKILKKAGPMKWTPEVEAALQDLKRYLSSTPTLVAPKPQEPLLLCLAATNQVVSDALVAQREVDEEAAAVARPSNDELGSSPAGSGAGKVESTRSNEATQRKKMVQRPVYFVSSLLQGARSRYSGMQKLLFGLLMASRKLRHYFQAHEITIVTRFPL
jgi:GTP:adenosylcobinamide-phosphate guanylyltransferase